MGKFQLNLRRQSIVLVSLVMVVMLSLTIFRLTEAVELSAVNVAFRVRGPLKPASPVVIVAIDDNTFDINGLQWPWPRTYFAQIVDRLKAGGAQLIAFDVFFFEPEALGQPATYTVQGDTLSSIAARVYGDPNAWPRILAANAGQIRNPNLIEPGETLVLPAR